VLFLFGDYALDADRRELSLRGGLIAVEPQVFDVLMYLVRNRERVVSKDDLLDAVWGGRVVSESTLTSRINAARRAVGDSGAQQETIRTVARKGFRFVAPVEEVTGTADREAAPSRSRAFRQETQFTTAADGTRIAYASVGAGPPLVKTGNWLTHLEYDWECPIWKPFYTEMACGHRLIRYDARGNGLSDWTVADFSFNAFVGDLQDVVNASGVDKFALLGISQGCAVAIAYAVRYPERLTHLVLYGGFARGWCRRGSPEIRRQMEAIETLIRQGWGRKNPAFRQLFTSAFMPDASVEKAQSFNELQRRTTSPHNAAEILRSINDFDVDDLLPQVRVPTLVLHARGDSAQPFEEGRRLAASIPGARFVALESRNHILQQGEPAWARFFDEVRAFLQSPAPDEGT
jgi:DNA-binding winged helix-turn-helix (wHTH) protein/alpha-beta hydrolase superfamily lysophospholipase